MTVRDKANPWRGGSDSKITIRNTESDGFTTSGNFSFAEWVQIFQSNAAMRALNFGGSNSTRRPYNVGFPPDGNVIVFWTGLVVPVGRTIGVTKYDGTTGEVVWDTGDFGSNYAYEGRGWIDGAGYSYFNYSGQQGPLS